MQQTTWDAIDKMLARHPELRADGVEYVEIESAALELGVRFPIDFAEYVRRYGSATLGSHPIYGPRRFSPNGRTQGTVVEATRRFRRNRWPGTECWIIFSMDCCGNPVGFDKEGKVWLYHRAVGVAEALAESFEAYLRLVCLKLASGGRKPYRRRLQRRNPRAFRLTSDSGGASMERNRRQSDDPFPGTV